MKSLRRRAASLILAAICIASIALSVCLQAPRAECQGGGWLSGWRYRRKIYVENQGSGQVGNYPVKIVVDTYTLIRQGRLRPDAGDLRFTDWDGVTLLDYWVNSTTVNSFSTECYVRLTVPAKNYAIIYMYYGNPSAVSAASDWAKPVFRGVPLDPIVERVQRSYTIPFFRPGAQLQAFLNTTYTGEVSWIAYATSYEAYAFSHMVYQSPVTLPSGTYTFYIKAVDGAGLSATWTLYLYRFFPNGTAQTLASKTFTIDSGLAIYSCTLNLPSPVTLQVNHTLCVRLSRSGSYAQLSLYWDNGVTRLAFPSTVQWAEYGSVSTLFVSRPPYGYRCNLYGEQSQSPIFAVQLHVTARVDSTYPGTGQIHIYNASGFTPAQTLSWTETGFTLKSSGLIPCGVDFFSVRARVLSTSSIASSTFYISNMTVTIYRMRITSNETHETIALRQLMKTCVRLRQSMFPPSTPSIQWSNQSLAWIYPSLSYVIYYFAGDEAYQPPQDVGGQPTFIVLPNYTVPRVVSNWFNVSLPWRFFPSNVSDAFRALAYSELGRLCLSALPLLILLVGGGHYAALAVLLSASLALWIEYSVGDVYSIFNISILSSAIFIGIIGLFRRRG